MTRPYVMYNEGRYISIDPNKPREQISSLAGGVYLIDFNEETGQIYIIPNQREFKSSKIKRYGISLVYENKIFSDYMKLTNPSLGVILSGQKGSGKSLMGESLCNRSIKEGIPVFYINKALPVGVIKAAIDAVGRCVVYIDEFEKIYPPKENYDSIDYSKQDLFLTLLSDNSLEKTLFIINSNTESKLNYYFMDRPGRFKYCVRFSQVDAAGLNELIDFHKLNRWQEKCLRVYANNHNYDVLNHVIEVLKNSAHFHEFNEQMSIMNAGGHLYMFLKIDSYYESKGAEDFLQIKSEPFTGKMRATVVIDLKDAKYPKKFFRLNFINKENKPYIKDIDYYDLIAQFLESDNDEGIWLRDETGFSFFLPIGFGLKTQVDKQENKLHESHPIELYYVNGYVECDLDKIEKEFDKTDLYKNENYLHQRSFPKSVHY